MDQDSYWRGYLMARHHVSLVIGIVSLSMALIFTLTGTCFARFGRVIYRAEEPNVFWQSIATLCVLGLFFLGLYFYTAN